MGVGYVSSGQGAAPTGGSNGGRKTDDQLLKDFKAKCLATYGKLAWGNETSGGEELTVDILNFLITYPHKFKKDHGIPMASLNKARSGDRNGLVATLRRPAARPQLPRLNSGFIQQCMDKYAEITGLTPNVLTPTVLAFLIKHDARIPQEHLRTVGAYMQSNGIDSYDPKDQNDVTAFKAAFIGSQK